MPALLVDINQAGLGRGLQFELFRPAEHETAKGFIAELPISLKITGSYHDLAYFAGDVARLSRIVTLSDISLTVQPKDQSLMLETVAKTFRYLDEEELARQKAAAKAKDKKPGAK